MDNEDLKYWQLEEDSILNGFGAEYFPKNDLEIIDDEFNEALDTIYNLVLQTKQDLLSSLDTNSVVTFFKFPDDLRTSCKQYLIYFAQFLADIGINADTEIKEEYKQTLFKVTPTDKTQSLELIRQALTIYLHAPSFNTFAAQIETNSDIALLQWESNIYHLKAQLALATSIIQAKDSTIESLQLSNFQYKQILESHSKSNHQNKEDIIKGIISVDKYETKGVSINLAEIFRRLKRTIRK